MLNLTEQAETQLKKAIEELEPHDTKRAVRIYMAGYG